MSAHRMFPGPTLLTTSLVLLAACQGQQTGEPAEMTASPGTEMAEHCAPDNGGLTLPNGFCAIVVAEAAGPARHLDLAENGDIFLALRNQRNPDRSVEAGGVLVLRDQDGDGIAETRERWGENGGNEVLLHEGYLYFAPDDAVLRYPLEDGSMVPSGPPDTIVSGLPDDRSHAAKSIAIDFDGLLYVNIGAPSNACQIQPRTMGSPGEDPCTQLEDRAGIWRFDSDRVGQTPEDGIRFVTGLRNVVALRLNPESGALFGVQHGRDQLGALWGYSDAQSAELPSEEFVLLEGGADFGWPYCYYDRNQEAKVLSPEYGGDGTEVGRCADKSLPLVSFPGHWAPNDIEFYTGVQFPEQYREGAFIAFHGSWNRAPEPQGGYSIAFIPFANGVPTGGWHPFADGFAGEDVSPRGAAHRPVGLAMGPDGSLYVSDSQMGTIWRIVYRGD